MRLRRYEKENPLIEKVDFNPADYNIDLILTDVRASHADLSDEYSAIPTEMKGVAKVLGQDVLSRCTLEELMANVDKIRAAQGDRAFLRAYHFLKETVRAKEEAWSLVNNVSGSKFSTYQNRDNTFYGYGWFIEQQPGFPKKVYHTGDNGGFQIYEGFFPEADLTVLVFENRNDKDRWDLVRKIDQILKDAGLTEPVEKQQQSAASDTTKAE